MYVEKKRVIGIKMKSFEVSIIIGKSIPIQIIYKQKARLRKEAGLL